MTRRAPSTTTIAERLHEEAFSYLRAPRSQAYKDGVLDSLISRLYSWRPSNPYAPGTAECDAYYAGGQEGLRIADEYKRGTAKERIS